jgi:Pyridoxamine 5'-phosphate oxidase
VIESGSLVHLGTLNADGPRQVSYIWVGLDDDEIVSGYLGDRQTLRNIARDARVALSIEGTEAQPPGSEPVPRARASATGRRPSPRAVAATRLTGIPPSSYY